MEKSILSICRSDGLIGNNTECIQINMSTTSTISSYISSYRRVCNKIIYYMELATHHLHLISSTDPLPQYEPPIQSIDESHVEDDIVIEHLPKIKVDKVLSYNPIDREVYDSYIDPSYPIDDRDRIYNDIWRKGMKDIVLNMVNIVRRHTCSKVDKVGYKGIEMYNDLSTLFSIGGGCIYDRCKIVLTYSNKHRYDPIFKDSIHRLALCYGISPSYHIWKWLYKFLSIYLLMDCTYREISRGKYEYHINLSNWIYYYIRP